MIPWLALALLPAVAAAQVYRSVDEAGNVTFSDSPPAEAVESTPVEIAPGPDAAQVREAQERLESQREGLEAQRAAREAAEAERREREARRRERAAEARRAAEAEDPDARAWWRYRGLRQPGWPRPEQPIERPRVPTGDHPDFWPGM